MISDEAVEAAARYMHDFEGYFELFEDAPEYRREEFCEKARSILEAAAPYLLAPVIRLADDWHKRGEDDMAHSKTFEDEDIAMAFLTEGASKVEAARHLRNALGITA